MSIKQDRFNIGDVVTLASGGVVMTVLKHVEGQGWNVGYTKPNGDFVGLVVAPEVLRKVDLGRNAREFIRSVQNRDKSDRLDS